MLLFSLWLFVDLIVEVERWLLLGNYKNGRARGLMKRFFPSSQVELALFALIGEADFLN